MQRIKAALIRAEGYPIGEPAPLHVNCACGTEVPIVSAFQNATCAKCGTVYDSRGWIIKTETVTL